MCLPQLGVRLDGYQSGAILLFRGTEMNHYVAPWEGVGEDSCRYAFDHTTHESVRRTVLSDKYQKYREYVKPDLTKKNGQDESKPDQELRRPVKAKTTKTANAKGKGKGKAKEVSVKLGTKRKEPSSTAPEMEVAEAGPSNSCKTKLRLQNRKRKANANDEEGGYGVGERVKAVPAPKSSKRAAKGIKEVSNHKSEPVSPREPRRSPRKSPSK